MVELYAHFPVVMWIIDGLIWALGVFFWVFTYIAAVKSKFVCKFIFQLC